MKYILFFIFPVIISCKKVQDFNKYHFSKDEITETDSLGNQTGHVQTTDWVLKPISNANTFDQKVFSQLYELTNAARQNPNTKEDTIFDFSRYNLNCSANVRFNVNAYPNPMQLVTPQVQGPIPTYVLHIRIDTDIKVANYLLFPVLRNGDKVGYVTYAAPTYNPNGHDMSNILFGGTPTAERDFILYCIIYSTDGCVYYFRGNVIGTN